MSEYLGQKIDQNWKFGQLPEFVKNRSKIGKIIENMHHCTEFDSFIGKYMFDKANKIALKTNLWPR